jgi:hypothetical protein
MGMGLICASWRTRLLGSCLPGASYEVLQRLSDEYGIHICVVETVDRLRFWFLMRICIPASAYQFVIAQHIGFLFFQNCKQFFDS